MSTNPSQCVDCQGNLIEIRLIDKSPPGYFFLHTAIEYASAAIMRRAVPGERLSS